MVRDAAGCKVMRAIWKTNVAINLPWPPCASPISRWMMVTKTNPRPTASAPTCKKASRVYKCSTPVIKRKGKGKSSREYHYEFHLSCPNCQTTYHVESAKRFVEQPHRCFDTGKC